MENREILSIKQRFGIIGNAPSLNHAIQVAIQVAATDLTVMITGESGSGKESFSKIIHQLSSRKHGKFIAINCGAIPEGTIDSELFGHEKGSFTGANEARKGYFEVTDGGTIFLDEIGEMPIETQARLLRVLENKEFIRVGSSKVLKTDVRVVAATNVNLLKNVQKGKFREDLYYRLNTVPIKVPPLRERGNDIELLFRKFATDFAEQYHVKPLALTPEAKQILINFAFPGNIRQLKNLAEQMSALELDRLVTGDTMKRYLPQVNNQLLVMDNDDKSLNERDLLYKVLFDMRQDMNDLKKIVIQLAQGKKNASTVLAENSKLFSSVMDDIPTSSETAITVRPTQPPANYNFDTPSETPINNDNPVIITNNETDNYGNKTYDLDKVVEVKPEEESLSIEKKEKELIIKALQKNNNKRKYAAQDLGISERTLYRKIKQYELDE
ncbi:sigma-54 interaction domain-containing protein [Flammeovirga kamogawensis]|uniref:Sigma-54 dependent transcriptional regulator n=1 Tax=Flammeovirga kamogawensis TaxID=373891 RepID=A0ABX8GVL1_9BACT|nr:sigma-54 dependent transcriptional regulator [Flammeovirga kamogawensis]MBB6461060.1 transcriptional regulator with PAS, ATPase and Fis domain [Flammeovirga kamogawensis]QWG07630.1 sigma-54 dependent transcriptional regulator [Flammeovirga kamogawensis]TRX69440.1 sigma-54-dependent Fis family transcriptional regulator [Flammeovirga kamogawensis]